jgi:hypothetical protein
MFFWRTFTMAKSIARYTYPTLMSVLFLFMGQIAPCVAGENPFVSPVFEELGLVPEEMPQEVTATIVDPSKLERYGLKGIDRDDQVDVINLGGGKLKIVHPDTGNTIEIILKNP